MNNDPILTSPWFRLCIYFWLAVFTSFLQDKLVGMFLNDPSQLKDVHPFVWVMIVLGSFTQGLIVVRSFIDQSLTRKQGKIEDENKANSPVVPPKP